MSDSNEMKVKFERIRIFRSRNRTKDFFISDFRDFVFFFNKKKKIV